MFHITEDSKTDESSETMSASETSEHGGIALQYIYFRTISSLHMLSTLLN